LQREIKEAKTSKRGRKELKRNGRKKETERKERSK
jgi:hypothetical protein